ncbi:MAG TPA: hypothetical protein VKB70_06500 [Gaiellaceae bacterium]|nr:hypothetical protein [Gaiellaceae bacterium]
MALTHVLLFFHLLGASGFFAGAAVVGTLQVAAIRRERPSEVYALLRLAPVGAALVGAGALLTLGFGIAHARRAPSCGTLVGAKLRCGRAMRAVSCSSRSSL